MAEATGRAPRGVIKLIALAAIVLGFLLLASGYRYGNVGTGVAGGVLLLIGFAVLVKKIAARNSGGGG